MRFDRTLLILKNYLGDAVMVTPLVDCLKENSESLTVAAGDAARAVLNNPDRPLQFVRSERRTNIFPQARELREGRYDTVFLVNRSFRSALTARLAAIPNRIGHSAEIRDFLLTRPVKYDQNRFEAESYNELATAVGLTPATKRPVVRLTDEERAAGRTLLQGATVALQPGARYATKQIPPDRLIEVARALQGQGHKIALVGGPDEHQVAHDLEASLDKEVVNLVGKCAIRETIGALANLQLTVGGDTGVMHLAAGVGCPTVTVFGPTPSVKWGHHYPPHEVLQTTGGDIAKIQSETILDAICRAMGE